MNKILFLWIALLGVNAYALPIPEFTSAVFGLGEVFLLLAGVLGVYFPFLKKGKLIYLVLIVSLGLNGYFIMSDNTQIDAGETRPGMLRSQEERNKDPRAIDEDKAYALMQEQIKSGGNKYVFVDARSQSETELGTAQGFIKMRWPDLVENYKTELKGRTVIATCWTGMRGSEVCAKLREHGIDCLYLKDGLKGWVARNLPVVLAMGVALESLGTSEVFDNSEKLLTAREVVNAKNTTIVDPRSPELFNKSSIPGSINIPFNELPTNEMEYRIKILPTQNMVVACYGILSCAEASGWGWEMRRQGNNYLGAYAGGIAAYNKLKTPINPSAWEVLPKHFDIWSLIGVSSFFLGILLWLTKAMSVNYFKEFSERKKLREKLTAQYDEVVAQREVNLKADLISIAKSFVILGLALIYSYAIGEIIGWSKYVMLPDWLAYLGSLIVGFGLTKLVVKKFDKMFFLTAIAISLGSLVLLKQFSNMGILMLILTCLVMYAVDIIGYLIAYKNVKFRDGYVDLFDAHHTIPAGTKAYRLSELQKLNVPEGIVVNKDFKGSKSALKTLGEIFTVRSSALNEDNTNSSHAGLNLSIVPSSEKTWLSDIEKVFESYHSDKNEIVLLQKYIAPLFAGVVFSRHPTWGGTILIEYGSGLAAKRMDGSENVRQVVLERATGSVVFSSDDALLKYVPQIYALLMKVENIYGVDQDVEWAIDNKSNQLWLLQARPQTALIYDKLNWDKNSLLKPGFKNLKTCELSFVMDNPTVLSASLICSLWAPGSSADIASRMSMWTYKTKLGMAPIYTYKFGRIRNSDYPALLQPNKFNKMIAKKMYKPDEIRLECNELLRQNKIHLAVDWSALDKDGWINLWHISLKNWKRMQALAFYFEYMASMMNEEVSHFSADTSYRALKDYEISMPRAIETGENLRGILFGENQTSINLKNKSAIYLREEYKHHCLTLYYSLRRGILDLQKRFGLGHEIFNAEYTEVENIFNANFRNVLKDRIIGVYELPDMMDAKSVALLGVKELKVESLNKLKGVFVSHATNMEGQLLRIPSNASPEEINKILSEKGAGSIVYSPFISPALVNTSKDYGIAGLCSLYGSTLSHPSILAREAKIPFVVGIDIPIDFSGIIKIDKEGQAKI